MKTLFDAETGTESAFPLVMSLGDFLRVDLQTIPNRAVLLPKDPKRRATLKKKLNQLKEAALVEPALLQKLEAPHQDQEASETLHEFDAAIAETRAIHKRLRGAGERIGIVLPPGEPKQSRRSKKSSAAIARRKQKIWGR